VNAEEALVDNPGPSADQRPDPEPPRLRASDLERDQVVALLSEHAATGRLTLAELEERAAQAYAAKTAAELAALLHDLPEQIAPVPRRLKARRWFVAIMGSSHRRTRLRLGRSVISIAVMASPDIDLCNAEMHGDEIVVRAFALIGSPDIYVPDSVEVEMTGFTLIGGDAEEGSRRPPRPGAPVIRIRSYALIGGYTVWRLPAHTQGLPYAEARRAARALNRGSS
jgi:hypothetical protein